MLTQRPSERGRRSTDNVQYWYDNNFLAWNVQRSGGIGGGRAATLSLKKIPF